MVFQLMNSLCGEVRVIERESDTYITKCESYFRVVVVVWLQREILFSCFFFSFSYVQRFGIFLRKTVFVHGQECGLSF